MVDNYGLILDNAEANEIGLSLLRLTRIANVALARADERNSSAEARERNSLEPKTSE